jgi:hypothetical protein
MAANSKQSGPITLETVPVINTFLKLGCGTFTRSKALGSIGARPVSWLNHLLTCMLIGAFFLRAANQRLYSSVARSTKTRGSAGLRNPSGGCGGLIQRRTPTMLIRGFERPWYSVGGSRAVQK